MIQSPLDGQRVAWLIDDNLMSQMRVEPQLRALGYAVTVARGVPGTERAPDLVVINLGSRGLATDDIVRRCRELEPKPRVVGFCGHLEVEIRRAAKTAGIDKILTNEQALMDLAASL